MKMKVGIRLGSGTSRINSEKVVTVTPPTDGKSIRYSLSLAWRKAALELYRKHFGGKRAEQHVVEMSYSGAMRPFGTWHVQFSTGRNPASLSDMYIVNVEEADG